MKAIQYIILFKMLFLIQSCGNKEKNADKRSDIDLKAIQSFEVYGKDTFNRTDYAKN